MKLEAVLANLNCCLRGLRITMTERQYLVFLQTVVDTFLSPQDEVSI